MSRLVELFFYITVIGLVLVIKTASADEVVDISKLSLEESKQITAGHTWECEWKNQYASGTKQVIYEADDVTKKKAVGKGMNSYCPDAWSTSNLKFKGDTIHVKNTNEPKPCVPSTGKYKLYKTADGSYYTKGNWQMTVNNAVIKGEESCKAVPR